MKIGTNYFTARTMSQSPQKRSSITNIIERLNKTAKRNIDTVSLSSRNQIKEENLKNYRPGSQIITPLYTRMVTDTAPASSTTKAIPLNINDENMEIRYASEQTSYTKEDALMNQLFLYRRNFSESAMTPPSQKDMEAFKDNLSENGLSEEINWYALKRDFDTMEVDAAKAERLEMKADYIASRYAVLKDRIQTQYDGDEQTKHMETLEKIYQEAKEKMADSYAASVGSIYESWGKTGTASDFRESILNIVDQKSADYQKYITENGIDAEISGPEEDWLLNDDAYMAAQLRKQFSTDLTDSSTFSSDSAAFEQSGNYTMEDLTSAGIFARSYDSALSSWYEKWDDHALGAFFARQAADVEDTITNSDLSDNLKGLLQNIISRPYIDHCLDKLDKRIDDNSQIIQDQSWITGLLRTTHINRDDVYRAYEETLKQMH